MGTLQGTSLMGFARFVGVLQGVYFGFGFDDDAVVLNGRCFVAF